MPYIEEVCVAGKTIEVSKYHSCRWNCKGEKRESRKKTTPECQQKINQRIAGKTLRRLMNANFTDDDYLIEMDFKKENRPSSSIEMQDMMKDFMKKLRKAYKNADAILKYIYVKELGPRGAAHVHMMLSRCNDKNVLDILKRCWTYGGIHVDPLNTDGQYIKVAEYFIKYADKTIETEGQLYGKRYYASRNLVRPEAKKRVIKNVDTFYENFKNVEGYYLDKESVLHGVTKFGYGYFTYTLHRIDEDRGG